MYLTSSRQMFRVLEWKRIKKIIWSKTSPFKDKQTCILTKIQGPGGRAETIASGLLTLGSVLFLSSHDKGICAYVCMHVPIHTYSFKQIHIYIPGKKKEVLDQIILWPMWSYGKGVGVVEWNVGQLRLTLVSHSDPRMQSDHWCTHCHVHYAQVSQSLRINQ